MANKTARLMIYLEPEMLNDFRVAATFERKKVATLVVELMQAKLDSMKDKIAGFKELQVE